MSWYPLRYYSSSPEPPGPTPPTPGENHITEIQIKSYPQQYYPNNSKIDLGDIRVDAIYDNGYSINVTNDCGFIPADGSLILESDTTNLNISYFCNDGAFYIENYPLYAVNRQIFNYNYNISNKINNFSNLFKDCWALDKKVNIPTWTSGSYFNYSRMFEHCSNFNQSINPIEAGSDCSYMFSNCNNFNQPITFNNLSSLSGTNIDHMFYGCKNFNQSITFPNTAMTGISTFEGCSNLNKDIYLPNALFHTRNMFAECYGSFNVYNFNVSSLSTCNYMFYRGGVGTTAQRINVYCEGTTHMNILENIAYATEYVKDGNNYYNTAQNIYFYNLNLDILELVELRAIQYPQVNYPDNAYIDLDQLVVFGYYSDGSSTKITDYTTSPSKGQKVTSSTSALSFSYNGLTNSIPLNVSSRDVFNSEYNITNNTNLQNLFRNCTNFNQAVTVYYPSSARDNTRLNNTSFMFVNCTNFNEGFIWPNYVTKCIGMFSGCSNLNRYHGIPNTIIDCSHMYNWCINFNRAITIPDSVTDCSGMFNHCNIFNSTVIMGNNIKNCDEMFMNCNNFRQDNIIIPESVADCSFMFYNCPYFGTNIYMKTNNARITGMLELEDNEKYGSRRINVFCRNLAMFNLESSLQTLVEERITWTEMTNGYYNTQFNIYLYNNLPDNI